MNAPAIARRRRIRYRWRLQCFGIAGLAAWVAVGGCNEPTGPRTAASADPAVKIPAIKQAVSDKELDQAVHMVKALESDDPAVRLYAIEGLQRLSGQDFGYRFYADVEQRRPAVEKWKQWLKNQSDD